MVRVYQQQQQQQQVGTLDEWGDYVGNESNDIIYMHYDGLVESIQNNDPAITSIEAWFFLGMDFDWSLAGQYLGESKYVKDLTIFLDPEGHPNDDVKSFCRGLANNTSISSLWIVCAGEYFSKLFKYLFPFFKNNTNVLSLVARHLAGFPVNVSKAIDASSSLISIEISADSDLNWSDANFDGLLIPTIIEKPGLEHLYVEGCMLSKNTCFAIYNVLSDRNCTVKSLSLSFSEQGNHQELDLAILARGLAENQTIKYLKLFTLDCGIMEAFLKLLSEIALKSLEKLHMYGNEAHTIKDPSCAAFFKSLSKLKYLIIEYVNFDCLVWDGIFSSVLDQSMSLYELKTMGAFQRDEHLRVLANCLQNNKSVKKLDLSVSYEGSFTSVQWCSFFDSIVTSSLTELTLDDIRIFDDYDIMASLSRYIQNNQQLVKLQVGDVQTSAVDPAGLELLANAICLHGNLSSLGIYTGVTDSSIAYVLATALETNPCIKQAEVETIGVHQFQAIGNAIGNPKCTIEDLRITHKKGVNGLDRFEEFEQITQILIDSLQLNHSIKVLFFSYWDVTNDDVDYKWSSFCELLCNTSSIEATYDSNHEIVTLLVNPQNDIPMELYSLLHLNTNPNKHAVARQKIIRYHAFEKIRFVPASLPIAMSWVGNEGTFSQLYGIVRNHPDAVQNRKKTEEILVSV